MSVSAVQLKEHYQTDVKLCYPFVEAMVNTLKVQCSIAATPGKPIFKDPAHDDKIDVLIVAGLNSPDKLGVVSIGFTKKVFLKLMSKMLGEIHSEITPELHDGAKELMNIAFNQAKKNLAEKGLVAIRSIPQITIGSALQTSYLTRGQTIVMPFDSDVGPFSIEITTQSVEISDSV